MHKILVAVVLICAIQAAVWAQQPAPESFKNTASVGLTITDGNSETLNANAALLSEGEKEGLGSIRAGVEANYGESTVASNKDTTVNNARAFVDVKKTLTKRTYASLNADIFHDEIAKIDYRATLGPGLGFYAVKNDRTSLSAEAGPAYIWEKMDGISDDYLALRCGERCEYAFSKTAKMWQSVEYLPRVDDFEDYLINFEIGAEAALNTLLSLRLVLQDKYDNIPAAGMKRNDLAFIGGVSLKL